MVELLQWAPYHGRHEIELKDDGMYLDLVVDSHRITNEQLRVDFLGKLRVGRIHCRTLKSTIDVRHFNKFKPYREELGRIVIGPLTNGKLEFIGGWETFKTTFPNVTLEIGENHSHFIDTYCYSMDTYCYYHEMSFKYDIKMEVSKPTVDLWDLTLFKRYIIQWWKKGYRLSPFHYNDFHRMLDYMKRRYKERYDFEHPDTDAHLLLLELLNRAPILEACLFSVSNSRSKSLLRLLNVGILRVLFHNYI